MDLSLLLHLLRMELTINIIQKLLRLCKVTINRKIINEKMAKINNILIVDFSSKVKSLRKHHKLLDTTRS